MLIDGLVRQLAGATVDLIVRGAHAAARPAGETVAGGRSSGGPLPEHLRVCYFRFQGGGNDEALCTCCPAPTGWAVCSATSVAWPVLDAKLRQRVIDEPWCPICADSLDVWQLGPDGHSVRVGDNGTRCPAGTDAKYR